MPEHEPRTAPTLTAWIYHSPMGAAAGEIRLRQLCRRDAVTLEDAVTLTWVPGAHRPRIGRPGHVGASASLRSTVLSDLAGVLLAASDGPGGPDRPDGVARLAGSLEGTGLDRRFLDDVAHAITPGSSALLVLARDADLDAVRVVVERGRARGDVRLLYRWLSPDAPARLQASLAELDGT